jgi:glycosyltransferase involved in cell wall biosynthesis/2-polyprenyl-3-methyl-5-hydroxy-6-metoxy-1,4-benzoquinol methylase
MKILVLTSTYPRFPGDPTAPFIESLVLHTAALGHELHVLVPEHRDWARAPVEDGVRYHTFRYSPSRSWTPWGYAQSLRSGVQLRKSLVGLSPIVFASAARACRTIVEREAIDVVHAHWIVPNGPIAAFALRGAPVPLALTVHGSDVMLAARSRVLRSPVSRSLRRASVVSAVSRFMLGEVERLGADPRTLELIPLGMDLDAFRPDPDARARIRARLGVAPDEILVLGIGRLIAWKGFDYLVEAISRVRKQAPNVRLVVAGDGDERSTLSDLVHRLELDDHVTFVGAVGREDVPSYYAAADLVAVPSIRHEAGFVEGLGYVALETLASGTPLVASAVGGLEESVTHGETGLLVRERDSEALADAILTLAGDPGFRERLGENGRRRALEAPDWPAVAGRWIETYERIVARGSPVGTAKGLAASSERFDATRTETSEDVVMGLYHRYSYELAAESLEPGDRVLDVGFGEGYGARVLAGVDYTGVELEPDLVTHARSRYPGRFEVYDGRDLPEGPFDLVVSFHVIEHVHALDPWLAEIARIGERALFATPNRLQRVAEGVRPWNRYHVREFTGEELQRALERHFSDVTVYGVSASPAIEAVELARYARARRIARLDPLGIRYRLPPRMDGWVRRRLRKPPSTPTSDFSLGDFSHSVSDVERALMLLAEARSPLRRG